MSASYRVFHGARIFHALAGIQNFYADDIAALLNKMRNTSTSWS